MASTSRLPFHKDLTLPRKLNNHAKENLSPTSTNYSQSPRQYCTSIKPLQQNKEKSQLCKKFMQNGFCPYRQKCKFAHGLHELRKNCQLNSKYKTKQCGVFATEGCCIYGDRCNFIHKKEFTREKRIQIDLQYLKLQNWRKQSRLLNILNQ